MYSIEKVSRSISNRKYSPKNMVELEISLIYKQGEF